MTPLVLVFDDDLVHHPEFLEGVPARFVYRPHADDALEDVAAHAPDVVLMDFSMSAALDGAAAVTLLRSRYGHAELPIVAISSDARMNALMTQVGATTGAVKMSLPSELRGILEAILPPGGER